MSLPATVSGMESKPRDVKYFTYHNKPLSVGQFVHSVSVARKKGASQKPLSGSTLPACSGGALRVQVDLHARDPQLVSCNHN